MSYRKSPAISGTDASRAAKDFDAWAFTRKLKLADTVPPWLADEPTDAMQFGTAVHMAILEPARYLEKAVFMPYVENFALKAGKDAKARAMELAEARNGFILRAEHAWAIERIMENFEPYRALLPGNWATEQSLVTNEFKGTADLLTDEWLVDLKTTRDIHRCKNFIEWERYDVQLAHYLNLFPREKSGIIFIENEAPYRVKFFVQDDEERKASNSLWLQTMERINAAGLGAKKELPF